MDETIEKISFFKKRINHYKAKRQNVLDGNVNCIPFPFKRFRSELPGIEQAKYYLVTGNEKSGKSQTCDFLFLITPLLYAYHNKDKIRLKVLYFTLEMSISEKYDHLVCFALYFFSKGKVRIDTKELNSLNEDNPLSLEVLSILESKEYQDFFDFVEDNVTFEMDTTNPFGIYKKCKEFAEVRGHYIYKTIKWKEEDGSITDKRVKDYFQRNDENEYWICITDHLSLLSTEKGMDLRETIGKFSSKDCVQLRNHFGFTIVNVQQQAGSKQGTEAFKLDKLTPSTDGLADNKMTAKDVNIMLTIFSPFKFEKPQWHGYNINDFKDNIRFLEVYLNRDGTPGSVCPLYFDGAVNFFAELPKPSDPGINYYKQLAQQAQS